GSVWLETSNANGVVSTNSRLQPQRLTRDPYFTNLAANGGFTVSPIIITTSTLAVAPSPVPPVAIRVLQIVPHPTDRSTPIGMIELDVSATPILLTVNNNNGRTDQRWILVNNQNRYMADSASNVIIASRGLTTNFFTTVTDEEPELI